MSLFDVGAPLSVGVRWLVLAGFSLLIGAAAMHDLVLDGQADGAVKVRMRRLLGQAAVFALGLVVLRLVLQGLAVFGMPPDATWGDLLAVVTGTTWGKAWMAQLVAVGGLVALASSPDDGTTRLVRWGLVLMLALAAAFSGHAAAVEFGRAAVLAADMLHLLAAGIWMGGLAALLWCGWARQPGDAFHRIRRRFSTLALASASVLVLSGVAGAASEGVTFANLARDAYSLTLIRKLVVVAIVALFGALNWRTTTGAAARNERPARFGTWGRVEVALGLAALLLTAILVATEPPGAR